MPRTRECDFCGADIEPGTGTMLVLNDGTAHHFCSAKCEKNVNLGREARQLEWTARGQAQSDARSPQQEETEAEPEADEAEEEEPDATPDLEEAEAEEAEADEESEAEEDAAADADDESEADAADDEEDEE